MWHCCIKTWVKQKSDRIFHKGQILDYHVLEGYTALQDGTRCLYGEIKEKKKNKTNHSMACRSPYQENPVLVLCVSENFHKVNEPLWKNQLPNVKSKLIVRVSRDQWSVMNKILELGWFKRYLCVSQRLIYFTRFIWVGKKGRNNKTPTRVKRKSTFNIVPMPPSLTMSSYICYLYLCIKELFSTWAFTPIRNGGEYHGPPTISDISKEIINYCACSMHRNDLHDGMFWSEILAWIIIVHKTLIQTATVAW